MSRRAQPSPRLMRVRGRLLRAVGRLERRPAVLGLGVAGIGALIAVVAALSVNGVPLQNRYEFSVDVPGDTPPLKVGDQARVAGKLAGLITKVHPERESVRVDVKLYPQFAPLGRDVHVHVGVVLGTSLAYLILKPGDAEGDPLPEGGTVPADQVTLSSSLPQALEAFDKRTRDAIALDLDVLGRAAEGQGRPANDGLADLAAVARDGSPLIDAMTPRDGVLRRLIDGGAKTARGLRGSRTDDLGATVDAAAVALEPLAARSERLGENFDRLAAVETEALATLPRTRRAFDAVTAALADLDPAARSVSSFLGDAQAFFAAGDDFRRETGRFSDAARPLLRRIAPVADNLIRPSRQIDAAGRPLAVVAEMVDSYSNDLKLLGDGLLKAFNYKRNGVPLLRASGSIGCHINRNPFPAPGTAFKDRKAGGC